jgi:ribosomal protein S27AE
MRKLQKEVVSTATNKDFFNLFFKSTNVTALIGYFGQLISGLTEFHFVFTAVGGAYEFSIDNLIPGVLGLVVVYIFEVLGVRVFLVRIVRQIALKQFASKEATILFVFNLLFVIALCGANIWFSWLGQKASFHNVTNVTVTDNSFQLETEKNAKIDVVTARHDDKTVTLNDDYKTKIDKSTLQYDGLINEYRTNRWTVSADKNKSKYNSYTALIDKAAQDKAKELQALNSSLDAKLEGLNQQRKTEIARIEKSYSKRINDIEKTEKSDVSLWQMVQKYTLPILIGFILLSWISIIYTEVFYKGSGQSVEVKEVSNRPLLLWVFAVGMYDKFYHWLYGKVVNKIGLDKYRYTEIRNNELEIKPQQLLNPTNVAATTGQPKTTVRQIGFGVQGKQNKTNDSNQNNIQNATNLFSAISGGSPSNGERINGERITVNVEALNDNQKPCKNCGKTFTYKHWNARYCSDKCRIENWEQRTGKTFNKKSKTK